MSSTLIIIARLQRVSEAHRLFRDERYVPEAATNSPWAAGPLQAACPDRAL